MTLQQGVVTAAWEIEKREYVAQVGRQKIEGLGLITQALGDNGWEIISVVALETSGATTGAVSKNNQKSRAAADVLAIFIKRYGSGVGEGGAGGPA